MPVRSVMPAWRQRRVAIGKKGAFEAELLWESELAFDNKPEIAATPSKLDSKPTSPISVATVLDVEIQPLVLPGSWSVVGKGGKPLKQSTKMYDEVVPTSITTRSTKKKHRTRRSQTLIEPEPLLATIGEAATSSCLKALDRSTAQHNKKVTRSKEAKFWAAYQQDKQLKREALAGLLAELDAPEDEAEMASVHKPRMAMATKDNKANRAKDKARRRARAVSAAARCYMFDTEDESLMLLAQPMPTSTPTPTPSITSEASLIEAMDKTVPEVTVAEVTVPDAWTVVGKRGKPVNAFPPLKASTKNVTKQPNTAPRFEVTCSNKRRKSSSEGLAQQPAPPKKDKGKKLMQKMTECNVM